MSTFKIQRRDFIRTTSLAVAALALPQTQAIAASDNRLPNWKGFNFLDFFSPNPERTRKATPEDMFKWMRDWGFDFVRVPMAYPIYLDIDYSKPITPDDVYKFHPEKIAKIDQLVALAHKYGLHVSLNLHRAPGYCINAGFHEPYNLWHDQEALDAFCHHWQMWAKRYEDVSSDLISFDLVNEPSLREDMNDQFGKREAVPAQTYYRVAKAAVAAIREIKPDALVIADGNSGGHLAVPALADLGIAQSCRGYMPFNISHHKAPWVHRNPDALPTPKWPDGPNANRQYLEEIYQPWFDLLDSGVGVHCGECGCYKETPHDVFLSWFGDVLDVLAQRDIGFALWEMRGDFGILNSSRTDVDYEDWYGYKLDRKLLTLLQNVGK